MELDNIIYDKDSLASAIAEQWSADSDLFASIYPSDTSTALINGMAAYGAMLQYTIVSALSNCYTTTAFSPAAIYQLADTLGNKLHGNVSSQVVVEMTKNNFAGINTIIPAYSTFEIDSKQFFNPHAIIIPATTSHITDVTLIQGEIVEVTKTTSGVSNEKFYFSSNFKASPNYISVYINGQQWNVVDSFLPYDKNYITDVTEMNSVLLKTEPDGRAYVKVGDGKLGTLPLSGSIIQIRYCMNDGADGNISETGVHGGLITPLTFIDTAGNQDHLDVEVITTSTAYGGFSKQSLDTLRYTSPWVFASGDRAIRRQDYNAILQNKCGYLTSNTWGEYEEAKKAGTYDSLMMNMVYYTGIKSFEIYPFFKIDDVTNPIAYTGALFSNSGFWGSYSFRVVNTYGSSDEILIQDTGAQGLLFINNDGQDPRDSLLPDWIASSHTWYSNQLDNNQAPKGIISQGKNYQVNDELYIDVDGINTGIIVRVTTIDVMGRVLDVELLTRTSENQYVTGESPAFATEYYQGTQKRGTGLVVAITQKSFAGSTLVTTNDLDEGSTETHYDSIENAMSNASDTVYYKSLKQPTLQNPVQIRIDYPNKAEAIAAIKFKATDPNSTEDRNPFIGTLSMFGTNIEPVPSYINVRNSDDWDRIIDRKYMTSPYGNVNGDWTDWIPTNCFTGEADQDGKPIFNKYRHYVIEFYSAQDLGDNNPKVAFSKMKALYGEDASVLYYNENGKIDIKFPSAGSPGPDTEDGYLTKDLIGSSNFPMYMYNVTIDGLTKANGYKDGDKLSYVYSDEKNTANFVIDVANIDNKSYLITIDDSEALVGNSEISLTTPVSLDLTKVYTHTLIPNTNVVPSGQGGYGYRTNDIVYLYDSEGHQTELSLRISSVNNMGAALSVVWLKDSLIGKHVEGELQTLGGSGSGLTLNVESHVDSQGSGATITITSANNLYIQSSFTGNRIDTSDINYFDEPIIKKYNHFTTYLEFKQPEIIQQSVRAQIAIDKNAPVSAGVVIQNVKNNVSALFDIVPDYIGKGLKLSDIYKAITDTKYVSWCKVLNPIDNVEASVNSILILSGVTIEEVVEETGN